MTIKLAEVGKKVSAANQAQIRAIMDVLTGLLDVETPEGETEVAEASVNIGKIETLADVKRAMQMLIKYIPSATARENLEGDADGDDDAEAIIQGAVGEQVEAYRYADVLDLLQEAVLTAEDRKNLKKSDFAIPEKAPGSGSYPIHDASHARDALVRSSGKPEESRVQAAVKKRYPSIAVGETETKEAGVVCAGCNQPVGRYDDFCGNCGEGLNRNSGTAAAHCVGCGSTLNEGQQFCSGCGTEAAPSKAAKAKESALNEAMKDHAPHASNFTAMTPATQKNHLMKMHGMAGDSPSLQVPAKRVSSHNSDHAAANDNDADDKKESASEEVEIESGFIPLIEKAISKNGTMQVKLIAPGWGTSGYYGADLLEKYGPKAFPAGTKQYWNHPTEDEERQRPERDLRDLAAVTTSDAHYLQEGPDGPGLYAQTKPFSTYAPAIEELAPYIGTSIVATGRGTRGEAEGKKGLIVESINKGKSCDFVTLPGAGGKIVQLFESVRTRNNHQPTEEVDNEVDEREFKEAQKKLREVESDRDRLQVRILLRDAKDMATDELAKVENIPVPTIKKLVESLSKDPPADDDGELDRPAFRRQIKEAAKAEAEYIESIRGSGRVRGMGRSNEDWESEESDDDDDEGGSSRFQESAPSKGFGEAMSREFGRLGLTESIAREAASGRR